MDILIKITDREHLSKLVSEQTKWARKLAVITFHSLNVRENVSLKQRRGLRGRKGKLLCKKKINKCAVKGEGVKEGGK
jgi:hypothetical protein